MIPFRVIFACALLGASAAASSQVLKCVDANGHATYAQTCPGQSASQSVKTDSLQTVAGSGNESKSLQEQDRAFQARRAQRINTQAAADAQARNAQANAQKCAAAQQQLGVLQTPARIANVNRTTGERQSVDDTQRQAGIDSNNAKIAQYCK